MSSNRNPLGSFQNISDIPLSELVFAIQNERWIDNQTTMVAYCEEIKRRISLIEEQLKVMEKK